MLESANKATKSEFECSKEIDEVNDVLGSSQSQSPKPYYVDNLFDVRKTGS